MSGQRMAAIADTAPPPSAQHQEPSEHMTGLSEHSTHGYDNLTPIADYEAENPYVPKQRLIPIKSDKALRTGEHSWKFHALCQTRGLAPIFTFDEVAKGCFTVRVQIGDKSIEDLSHFPSKREAKEAICKSAISDIPTPEPGKGKGTKRKSSEIGNDATMQDALTDREVSDPLDAEDYISILNLYTQRQHMPLPEYSEMRTIDKPERFLVTVTFEGGPLTPFGEQATPRSTKKKAKQAAAQEAVLWLRSEGKLSDSPTVKRRKSESALLGPENTGLTQAAGGLDLDPPDTRTSAQKVHELCHRLGLTSPRFETWPSANRSDDPLDAAFVTMVAYFSENDVRHEPMLGGPVGLVERVYGKKQAKEMCCQAVLRVLENVRQSRLALL